VKIVFIMLFLLPLLVSKAAGQHYDQYLYGLKPLNENLIIKPKGTAKNEMGSSISDDSAIQQECSRLYYVGKDYSYSNQSGYLKMGYDTLRHFIEDCATYPNVADGAPAWGAFSRIDACVALMDTSNIRWLEYREWLKRVLYLSSDSMYYCSDVTSMLRTFSYVLPGRGPDYNGLIAVFDYLIQSKRCPDQIDYLLGQRAYYRDYQYEIWLSDTTKQFDTAAVSIDSIGFSILKGPQFGAVKNHPFQNAGIGEIRAKKNPFTNETTLETTISDAMMLRLEVFDVLGKQLYAENEFFSSGDVKWKLDGKLLPKGSLYARVSTIGGAVKTIKLVKD
jgi:hypothetical protein